MLAERTRTMTAEQGEKEDGEGELAQVTLVTPQTQRRTGGQNV